jgi:hypothetical protein
MQTLIGILVQPYEEQRISLLIEGMQAQKHWLSVDDCLYEILNNGIITSEALYRASIKNMENDHAY